MRKLLFASSAALALSLSSAASAQVPAQVDLDKIQPILGSWSYRSLPTATEATFTDTSAAQRLIIRCNRAGRTVSIVRTGVPAAAATLSVWTSSASRALPSRYLATKQLIADVAATDPILDAIAFSRSGFATAASDAPLLVVPTWREPARVVEDCRS